MKIENRHTRNLNKPKREAECLINSLASDHDLLWPHETWSPMRLDRGLSVGAAGGHGPIQYEVVEFCPGEKVTFRFTGPSIFRGHHGFELHEMSNSTTEISHTILMDIPVYAMMYWRFIIRPMHDALIEDAFDKAQRNIGSNFKPQTCSPWVRILRWILVR